MPLPTRMTLHKILTELTKNSRVYFQPPENISLVYPCIVYERSNIRLQYADDACYHKTDVYSVTYITKDPDDPVPDKLLSIRGAAYDRHYTSNNLHHTVVNISIDRSDINAQD